MKSIRKKGDLSLSINAIVILILAITLLGLGLAFIKGQFSGVANKLGAMTEQIDAGQKAQLENSPEKITMQSTDLEIKRGESREIYFGLRNVLDKDVEFSIEPVCIDYVGKTDKIKISFSTFEKKTLSMGSSSALPLIIKADAGAELGIYSCELNVNLLGKYESKTSEGTTATYTFGTAKEPYFSKSFYIKVIA